jgi:hypothetical protein
MINGGCSVPRTRGHGCRLSQPAQSYVAGVKTRPRGNWFHIGPMMGGNGLSVGRAHDLLK